MPGYKEVRSEVVQELMVQRATQKFNIPIILGPPGIGKTAMHEDIAIELEALFCHVNVGDAADPTELTGIPVPADILAAPILSGQAVQEGVEAFVSDGMGRSEANERVHRIVWALNRVAYLACTQACYIVYDDIDKAPDPIMKALIGVMGTRRYRDGKLHKLSLMAGAGNRPGDDQLAGDLSESILGRTTAIELEASFKDYADYAADHPDEVHVDVLGFLASNPDMLYQPPQPGHWASPNPRSWNQVSAHFFTFPNMTKAQRLRTIERKVGAGVKNTWTVWFDILSRIDVDHILTNGPIPVPQGDNGLTHGYACVFAVCKAIAERKISPTWVGLERFVDSLENEMKTAMLVQIPRSKRGALRKHFKNLGDSLLAGLI